MPGFAKISGVTSPELHRFIHSFTLNNQHNSSPVSLLSVTGEFLYANDAFCRLSGFGQGEELSGKNYTHLSTAYYDLNFYHTLWQDLQQGHTQHREIKCSTPQKTFYWVQATFVPIPSLTEEPTPALVICTHIDITHRKLGEEQMAINLAELKEKEVKLANSEHKLITAQQVAQVGSYVFDYQSKEVEWSEMLYELLGVSKEFDINASNYSSFIHPDDREKVMQYYKECIALHKDFYMDYRMLRPDGETLYIYDKALIIRNENKEVVRIIGTLQNITARKKAEQRLVESEAYLRALFNSSIHSFYFLDPSGNILWLNYEAQKRIQKQFGTSALRGQSIKQFLQNENSHKMQQWLQKAVNGNKIEEEISETNHTQITVWYMVSISPVYDDAMMLVGVSFLMQDISIQKRNEIELQSAKKQAEEAALAKQNFLSSMSHELRTPMNAVIGITHMLLADQPRPEQIERLKTLRFASETLLSLINDILDYEKIEAGKISLERIDFHFTDILQGIHKTLSPKAEEKGIRFSIKGAEQLPKMVVGDPTRITQILLNLVGNAIKFTDQGYVKIDVDIFDESDEEVVLDLAVIDTGIGIPKEKQAMIFERFVQADSDITRRFGGTGLGLTITKHLLELMGSNIMLESSPQQGSRFYFRLSLPKSSAPYIEESAAATIVNYKNLDGIRVLLVEDNEINRYVVKQFLDQWNARVDFAVNGRIGVEKAQSQLYDLVLMDLQMPEMDGYEATRQIRAMQGEYFARLPIIALTASVISSIKHKAFEAGMDDYMMKPFNPDELYNKLAAYTGKNSSDQSFSPYQPKLSASAVHGEGSLAAALPEPDAPSKEALTADNKVDLTDVYMITGGKNEDTNELMLLFRNGFVEFLGNYQQAWAEKSAAKMESVIHKISSTVRLLRLQHMLHILQTCRDASSPEWNENDLGVHSPALIELCRDVIEQLEELAR